MTRTLCWTLAAVTEKERPLSLLWSSGQQQQQHARLFVFQIPLWVRPLVYATQCLLQLSIQPQTVSLTKECQTPSYDSPDHHLERNTVFSTSYFCAFFFFCFPFFCIRGQFGDKHEGGYVFARRAFLNRCISLLPRLETSNRRWMQTREITAQPGECYLLQVITQLSVNTVAGDTMPRREVEDTQTAEWFASTPERSQRRGRTCEGKGKCRNTVREKAHVCFSW